MQSSEKSRRLKNGSYSSIITVIVIVALLVVNFIVNRLPATLTKLDLSEQQMTTISEQTKELASSLEDEVVIYYMVQEGNEDTVIEELLNKYETLSSKITVETIDTALYPTFYAQYTDTGLTDNSLIVVSEARYKVVPYEDIYVTEETTDSSGTTSETESFDGENQLTSALDFVTSDSLPVIYAVSGHSETSIPDDLVTQINNQNIDVQTLNLIQEQSIPEDCGALLFYAPLSDITEAEVTLIEDYVDAGGGLYVVTTWQADDMPNLDTLLAKYGVTIGDGMVMEGDTYYTNANYPYIIFAQLESHTITDPLIENSLNVLVAQAQPLSFDAGEDTSLTGTRLLTTTSSGYVKSIQDINNQNYALETETETTETVYGVVEKDTDGDTTGKVAVCTTPMMFDSESNEYSAGGNYDLVINTVGWMCEHESAISIHSKSMSSTVLQVSSAQANIWSTVTVAFIPIILLVAGIVIWLVRRKR